MSILGNFSMEKFKDNIKTAINVYKERVDGTKAMETEISLYPGIEDSMYHRRRQDLLVYLTGTKSAKNELKHDKPKLWKYFEKIWLLRENHLVKTPIPSNLAFVLYCCGNRKCPHPLCREENVVARWHPSGPLIKDVMPIPEVDVAPSTSDCSRCGKRCDGHYKTVPSSVSSVVAAPIPSVEIKKEFEKNENLTEEDFQRIARKCLISAEAARFYAEHLKTVKMNRQKGVIKAQKTRAAKKLALSRK